MAEKLFISWSGERSQSVAKALHDWIPKVIQAVSPWLSTRDLPKGSRWSQDLAKQLEETKIGLSPL